MERGVVIIGGGVGGLAAAVALSAQGRPVTLYERAGRLGGKARSVTVGGSRIDTGPTVLTWRDVFDGLFARAGTRLEDHVTLVQPEVLARHFWPGGRRLDLFSDPARSRRAVARFAGEAAAAGYDAFLARAGAIHHHVQAPFLDRDGPEPMAAVRDLGPSALVSLARIQPLRTMWGALGRHFRDPRLRQLFARYATYVGGSPYRTPATFNLVAHVEQQGVWQVVGGMSALAAALARVARARGAVLHTGMGVSRVRFAGGRAVGVLLEDGTEVDAEAVLYNGDVAALGRLGPEAAAAVPAVPTRRRSLSALTLAAVGEASGAPLAHHNVFFSEDYRAEFRALARGRLPEVPTVYVCAQDRVGDASPAGPERLLYVINAPPRGDRPAGALDDEEVRRCLSEAHALMERCGVRVRLRAAVETTPVDLERRFPGTGGALYGPSPHGPTASLRRSGVRSTRPGLYLAGGSVHPGPGVPLSAMSGVRAADAILSDLETVRPARPAPPVRAPAPPSTSPPLRAATGGGTSTS